MASGDVVGTAIVNLQANTAGFLSSITSAVSGAEKSLSGMGGSMTGSMKGVGGLMTAGITAPIVAIGMFAIKSSSDVNGAMTNMVRATNTTGGAVDKLKTSFKNVFTSVPESAAQVGTAMTTVHNRLGLTGTDLEHVTKQGLELARMLGTDVNGTVESAAKAFEAWHIPTNQMSGDMDKLYTVATKTGVPLSELTNAITKGGAVASNAHVSFDTMTATVGALGSAGIPARQGVTIITDAITKLQSQGKNAGTELPAMFGRIANGTATAADKALLGQKNFDKLSGSLKDNKNNYDSLMKAMAGSKGAIDNQAQSTMKFSEKLDIFKNKAETAFAPLGKTLIDIASKLLDALGPVLGIVEQLLTFFSGLPAPVQMVVIAIAGIAAAIGPILMILGPLQTGFEVLTGIMEMLGITIDMSIVIPLLPIIAIVAAIGIGLLLLYMYFKPFHDAVDEVVGWVKTLVGDLMSGNFGKFGDDFKKGILAGIAALMKIDWGDIAKQFLTALLGIPPKLLTALVNQPWGSWANTLWKALQTALGTIGAWLWSKIQGLPGQLWTGITTALATFGTWLLLAAAAFFIGLPVAIVTALIGFGDWLLSAAGSFFTGLPGSIQTALVGLGQWMLDAAASFFSGLTTAVQKAISDLQNARTPTANENAVPTTGAKTPLQSVGLQHGGLVTKPTLAVIGEAGPELVVPTGGIQEYWHHIQQPQGYHQSVERVQRQARRKTSRNKSWR